MHEIEKLFRKISKKDRIALRSLAKGLLNEKEAKRHFNIKKLKDSEFYRLRGGKCRIIFHYNSSGNAVIDSVRLRSEDTYKDF